MFVILGFVVRVLLIVVWVNELLWINVNFFVVIICLGLFLLVSIFFMIWWVKLLDSLFLLINVIMVVIWVGVMVSLFSLMLVLLVFCVRKFFY